MNRVVHIPAPLSFGTYVISIIIYVIFLFLSSICVVCSYYYGAPIKLH